MEIEKLISLYELYGFNIESKNEDYIVFTHTNGYFNNSEIIRLSDRDLSGIEKDLKELGYSVKICEVTNYEHAHENLFKGFFTINNTKKRILQDYIKFCESQKSKLLCSNYEYLSCDYHSSEDFGDIELVDCVFDKLNSDDPQLIILEAAAGYGKTCTSFEILSRFTQENVARIPMMTELSRNRKASIFRYVLLSEIDARFPSLSQKTVEYEIRNGNVPLIVDGFDELLSKSVEDTANDESAFEETQGMLDTIVKLLNNGSKAKILVTSRKSAVFVGEKFDEWVEQHDLGRIITRIEICAPSVTKWLGYEKVSVLNNNGINSTLLSNPIILSLLKRESCDSIKEKRIDGLLNEYFSAILNRERKRQNLLLTPQEQNDILTIVASRFAEFDITAEEPGFIKLIVEEIIEKQISNYIKRYAYASIVDMAESIPNEDEFCLKLVHHALLDRKSFGKNMIGFINDFIFGYFLGQAVIKGKLRIEPGLDYRYVDLICAAYMPDDMKDRKQLEVEIEKAINQYTVPQQLNIFNKFYHTLNREYVGQTITGVDFCYGFKIGGNYGFKQCIFSDCIFDGCVFDDNAFRDSQFYNCIFYEPQIISTNNACNANLTFLGCSGHEELVQQYASSISTVSDNTDNYEKIILEQFWKIGRDTPEKRRSFTAIKKGINPKNMAIADKALTSLLKKGILRKLSICYELDFSKAADIRNILGRE